MTRKKVKLAFLSNYSARKSTYRKRKKGIIKKVSELTILCDIPACAIFSDPINSDTEVWPDLKGAKHLIERYQNSSVIEGTKNLNQESYLLKKIAKVKEQLIKQRHHNRGKQLTLRMIGYMKNKELPNDLSFSDLEEFDKQIEKNLKEIENKIVDLSLSN